MSGEEVPISSQESAEKALDTPDVNLKDASQASMTTNEEGFEDSKASEENNVSQESVPPLNNEARLEQLEKEHNALREEHETLRSQYMRIAADFDNFRKRQTRDQEDLRLQLTCTTLSEILPIVDNFERARQQLEPQGEEAQALHRSYQGLYKQLVDVLKQLGVAPMRVVGQTFDPNLHEAVMREPSDQQSEDVVIEEMQRGYHLNGRVLRHALVKVSMGPGPAQEISDNSSQDELNEQSVQTGDSMDGDN